MLSVIEFCGQLNDMFGEKAYRTHQLIDERVSKDRPRRNNIFETANTHITTTIDEEGPAHNNKTQQQQMTRKG